MLSQLKKVVQVACQVDLFGHDPDSQSEEDLRRFKQLMEAGEIATIVGQTSYRG